MTDVYRVFPFKSHSSTLAERLYQLFKDKERSDVARIHQMLDFFQADSCLSYTLCQLFCRQPSAKALRTLFGVPRVMAHLPL